MLVWLVTLAAMAGLGEAGWQSVRVAGTLYCQSAKAGDKAWLELYDDHTLGNNDEMDKKTVEFDENGRAGFSLEGTAKDGMSIWAIWEDDIEPIFKVYHDCDDVLVDELGTWTEKPCQRRYKAGIDHKYVTKGKKPSSTFDVGVLNLALETESEERDCNIFRTAEVFDEESNEQGGNNHGGNNRGNGENRQD